MATLSYTDLSEDQLDEIESWGEDDHADWWLDTRTNELLRSEPPLRALFEAQNRAALDAGTICAIEN